MYPPYWQWNRATRPGRDPSSSGINRCTGCYDDRSGKNKGILGITPFGYVKCRVTSADRSVNQTYLVHHRNGDQLTWSFPSSRSHQAVVSRFTADVMTSVQYCKEQTSTNSLPRSVTSFGVRASATSFVQITKDPFDISRRVIKNYKVGQIKNR